MVWAIVVVAIAVLGVAAWAGTGKLGEMPGAVTDRPKAHIPDGPVDDAFLRALVLPVAGTGYSQSQVDAVLAARAAGEDADPGTRFRVVARGYDMQAVDAVIERFDVDVAMNTPPTRDDPEELSMDNTAANSVGGDEPLAVAPKEGSLSVTVPASNHQPVSTGRDSDSRDSLGTAAPVDEARLREDEDHAG